MPNLSSTESEWLRLLSKRQPKAQELLSRTPEGQRQLGYYHTLREILQQPSTWLQTCSLMLDCAPALKASVQGIAGLVLTGSGSSEYAGDCVSLALQQDLGITTQAIGGGRLLTDGRRALPPPRPALLVSLARSGDSPESCGALSLLLELEPEVRHLVLTCNQAGSLAKTYQDHPQVRVVTMPASTNDQSLVMTSSFTNLALAARFLGLLEQPQTYQAICGQLSTIVEEMISAHFGSLATVAAAKFSRAVFLGSGSRFAATREAALKMLEMTSGRVPTLCETYLSFRHGPMTYVQDDTLLVCFLSSDPVTRAYESDLLRELDQKELGLLKLIVGEDVPQELAREDDVVLACRGLAQAGDDNTAIVHVVVGQLLAFLRCLEEGLRPDLPSQGGIINRVVQSFQLHHP
jgi:tagatose-6-phosphate ketose/aldose isomerase